MRLRWSGYVGLKECPVWIALALQWWCWAERMPVADCAYVRCSGCVGLKECPCGLILRCGSTPFLVVEHQVRPAYADRASLNLVNTCICVWAERRVLGVSGLKECPGRCSGCVGLKECPCGLIWLCWAVVVQQGPTFSSWSESLAPKKQYIDENHQTIEIIS